MDDGAAHCLLFSARAQKAACQWGDLSKSCGNDISHCPMHRCVCM